MSLKKTPFALIVIVLPFLLFASCHERKEVEQVETADSDVIDTLTEEMIMEEIQWHLDHGNFKAAAQWRSLLPKEENIAETEPEPEPEPAQPAAKKQTARQDKAKKTTETTKYKNGTIYISTYGANGKVWGHVNMNGNKGRGTIHDDDENSLSITVTRHGNELFGTDQNGREYVFKL